MSVHVFDSFMNSESVAALISQIEDYGDESITLYFSTEGGETSSHEVLSDYLIRSGISGELILFNNVSSSGFYLTLALMEDFNITVLDSAWSVVHISTMDLCTRELLRPSSLDNFLRNRISKEHKRLLKALSPVLTAEELTQAKEGKDIFLDTERLRNIVSKRRHKGAA